MKKQRKKLRMCVNGDWGSETMSEKNYCKSGTQMSAG